MKVYISGPISGDGYYREKFKRAEEELRASGYEPVNPTTADGAGMIIEYKDFIDFDLDLLAECDGIYMLKGWRNSKGARLEYQYAVTVGLWIAHQ